MKPAGGSGRTRDLHLFQPIIAAALLAAVLPAAPAAAQQTASAAPAQDDDQLPADMAEVLTAVQATRDPRALDALVQYLLRTHPESQAAITAWVERSAQLASLASAAPPANAAPQPASGAPASASSPPPDQAKPQPAASANADVAKWTGEGELGAFVSTGSTPGSGFVGRLSVITENRRWRIAASGRIDYQKALGAVTRNQLRLTFEPNYKFDARGYIFGLGQYEKDRFQGFTDRYSLSGGLGYNLLEGEGRKLSIKAGPAMRVTQQVEGPTERTLSAVALADLKLKLTPSLNYSQDMSAYFDAVRRTFYTLAAIDSQLTGKLRARVSYTLQHEAGEGDIRTLTDTTSRLTLIYGF